MRHVHAEAGRRVLVLADRAEVVAAPRALEPPGGGQGEGEERERDVVVDGLGLVELEVEQAVGTLDRHEEAAGTADAVPVEDDGLHDLTEPDGGDGEIVPAKPEDGIADRLGDEHGQPGAGHHPEPRRERGLADQQGGGVSADAEVDGVSE